MRSSVLPKALQVGRRWVFRRPSAAPPAAARPRRPRTPPSWSCRRRCSSRYAWDPRRCCALETKKSMEPVKAREKKLNFIGFLWDFMDFLDARMVLKAGKVRGFQSEYWKR